MAIEHYAQNCGCVITVYGDHSAPPDVEHCADHAGPTSETEIFALMLDAGEMNRLKAAELIRKLDATARRDLRAACQELDNLIDDVWLEELREKRRSK
jgi:hypothetical protein